MSAYSAWPRRGNLDFDFSPWCANFFQFDFDGCAMAGRGSWIFATAVVGLAKAIQDVSGPAPRPENSRSSLLDRPLAIGKGA